MNVDWFSVTLKRVWEWPGIWKVLFGMTLLPTREWSDFMKNMGNFSDFSIIILWHNVRVRTQRQNCESQVITPVEAKSADVRSSFWYIFLDMQRQSSCLICSWRNKYSAHQHGSTELWTHRNTMFTRWVLTNRLGFFLAMDSIGRSHVESWSSSSVSINSWIRSTLKICTRRKSGHF